MEVCKAEVQRMEALRVEMLSFKKASADGEHQRRLLQEAHDATVRELRETQLLLERARSTNNHRAAEAVDAVEEARRAEVHLQAAKAAAARAEAERRTAGLEVELKLKDSQIAELTAQAKQVAQELVSLRTWQSINSETTPSASETPVEGPRTPTVAQRSASGKVNALRTPQEPPPARPVAAPPVALKADHKASDASVGSPPSPEGALAAGTGETRSLSPRGIRWPRDGQALASPQGPPPLRPPQASAAFSAYQRREASRDRALVDSSGHPGRVLFRSLPAPRSLPVFPAATTVATPHPATTYEARGGPAWPRPIGPALTARSFGAQTPLRVRRLS